MADALSAVFERNRLLSDLYREPTITAYNRLEARARTEDFERSLRAEIRDPLWMLTRQWQMGELEAEDAGSPIDARLLTTTSHVDRLALGEDGGQSYDEATPIETLVERERVPWTHALRVQVGQFFLRLHSAALRTKYAGKYLTAFPFPQNAEDEFRNDQPGLNLYGATRRRDIDGERLLAAIEDGTLTTKVSAAPLDVPPITAAAQQLVAWLARQYSQRDAGRPAAWDPARLTYAFRAAAPVTAAAQMVLDAARYHEGRVDWYSFDFDRQGAPLASDQPPTLPDPPQPISFLPAAATFKGMPNPRFWEMEDRQINFGKLNARTTDHLLLLFAEMGLIYGNDWFVIPYSLAVNSLCQIDGLVITDVFGDRVLVRAADEGTDAQWQRWSMFSLSNKNAMEEYNRQFFLPAALTTTLEGEPLEEVNYLRDEMANMVWGVEDRIPSAAGIGIDGHEAADKTGVLPPPIGATTAAIRYLLGTTVPENWIPFLPVHQPGSAQDIRFQRAAMPKLGVPPRDVVKAKGVLLTEVQPLYFVDEGEIPYAGTIVRRSFQRTRWYGGRTFVWIGRYRETGRGQGSSNLRFDQIEPVAAP
jgi:hypothetical protein